MDLLKVLSLGNAVADPAKWKTRQITVTLLTGVLTGLLNYLVSAGYQLPFEITVENVNTLVLTGIALWNTVLTLITSKTVGLPSKDSDS